MIESIEFSEGVLRLAITRARSPSPGKSNCSIEFDFRKCGRVAELHRGEFVDFLDSIHAEDAHHIGNVIFELFCAHPGIRRVYFDLIYRSGEPLEGSAATNEEVKLARGTV